jgi:tetratricopeptide (TPR) repeat protein
MLLFLSSSTDLSREVELLRRGIANLNDTIDVFTPDHNIQGGEYWRQKMLDAIKKSSLAIFCLSRDSLRSDWLGYEVGLFSGINASPIVCLLIDLPPSELPAPLVKYQTLRTDPASLERFGLFISDLADRTAGGEVVTGLGARHERLARQLPLWAESLSRDINGAVATRARVNMENRTDYWFKAVEDGASRGDSQALDIENNPDHLLRVIRDAATNRDTERLHQLGLLVRSRININSVEVIKALLYAHLETRNYQDFIELLQYCPTDIQNDSEIRVRLAQVFLRNNRAKEALPILEEVTRQPGTPSEWMGLLGRTYKQLWREYLEQGDKIKAKEYLEKSAAAYATGFDRDPHSYLGSNAVGLFHLLGTTSSLKKRDELIPKTERSIQTEIGQHGADYWSAATQLELAAIKGEQARAKELASVLASNPAGEWALASTAAQLRLLSQADVTKDDEKLWISKLATELEGAA